MNKEWENIWATMERINKQEWAAKGGLDNPELLRKRHGGGWTFWAKKACHFCGAAIENGDKYGCANCNGERLAS